MKIKRHRRNPRPKRRRALTWAAAGTIVLLLVGCGYKGPLTLPENAFVQSSSMAKNKI